MTDQERIARLRKQHSAGRASHLSKADRLDIADRIEELVKERDAYLAERNKFQLYLQRTHADWELEVAAVDVLSAKLAKAVEELQLASAELLVIGVMGLHPTALTAANKARAVLAELEGGGEPDQKQVG